MDGQSQSDPDSDSTASIAMSTQRTVRPLQSIRHPVGLSDTIYRGSTYLFNLTGICTCEFN